MSNDWPKNDREWARSHIGCNPSTCPNGKCKATGECIDIEAQRAEQARQNRG